MNYTLPTGRAGQTIAVLLVLLVVVAAWRLAVMPLFDVYQQRMVVLEHRAAMAARLEGLAAELPQLKATAPSGPPKAMTMAGSTDAITAATLQSAIQDMVGSAAGTLGSVESLPAEAVGSLRRIGIRVAFAGSFRATMRVLQSIGRADPPMLVDELQIHANTAQIPANQVTLNTSLVVFAFRAGDGGEGKP
jgi:hypothetical protein